MKQPYLIALVCVLLSLTAKGQQIEKVISDRQANSQRVQEITTRTNETGEVFSVTNSYVQLEPGLNFWNGNGWSQSVAAFSIVDGMAVADKGSHKVILQPNINQDGAVYMKAADGSEFWSSPLFLALRSTETGQAILIATLKDSIGQLVAPNVVLYTNAFEGDGCANDQFMREK